LLTCAHPAWKSISAPLFFCTSGKETVENLKISHRQLAPCQENRIKGQQTVSSAGCKVLASNAGFLLASMPSYCRFRPIECCYSQSVSVSVPQDKIWGSAINMRRLAHRENRKVPDAPSPDLSMIGSPSHAVNFFSAQWQSRPLSTNASRPELAIPLFNTCQKHSHDNAQSHE